jgi:hypothetical protein
MSFESGRTSIPNTAVDLTVTLKNDFGGSPPDTIIAVVSNEVDVTPLALKAVVVAKTATSFTVDFYQGGAQTSTDSGDYYLEWVAGTNRLFFEIAQPFVKKITQLPPLTVDPEDVDLLPIVKMGGLPKTYQIRFDKLLQNLPRYTNEIPSSPTDPAPLVNPTPGPVFAMDDNYLYTKLSGRWAKTPRERTTQAWDNALVKEGNFTLGAPTYENITEMILYFPSDNTVAPADPFQAPDPPFDLSDPTNLPLVLVSFRGFNTLEDSDPITHPPGGYMDLVGGVVTEVSLDTPPTDPIIGTFPVPATYEGHFRVSFNTPLILDRTGELPAKGENTYYMNWKAIQEIK